MSKEAKSKGHVAFVRTSSHGDFEFYVLDGEVYRAPVTNAMDVGSGARFGRWEGPERHLSMLLQQQVDVAKKFGGKVEIDRKHKKLIKEDTMAKLNGLLAGLRQDEACPRGRKTPRGRGVQDGRGPHGSGMGFGRVAEDIDDVIHESADGARAAHAYGQKVLGLLRSAGAKILDVSNAKDGSSITFEPPKGQFSAEGVKKLGFSILQRAGVNTRQGYSTHRGSSSGGAGSIAWEFDDVEGIDMAIVSFSDGGNYGDAWASISFEAWLSEGIKLGKEITRGPARGKKLSYGKLERRTRDKANLALLGAGLDGNGRFRKPSAGLTKALDVLSKSGIESDQITDAHRLSQDQGHENVRLAFTNIADSFSPTPIENTVLAFSWTKLRDGVYECLAYLS